MAQSFLFLLFFSVILTSSFVLFCFSWFIGWPASYVVLCNSSLFILVIITILSSFYASAPFFFIFPICLFFPDRSLSDICHHISPILGLQIKEIIQQIFLCILFHLFNVMFLRFIHAVCFRNHSFLLLY